MPFKSCHLGCVLVAALLMSACAEDNSASDGNRADSTAQMASDQGVLGGSDTQLADAATGGDGMAVIVDMTRPVPDAAVPQSRFSFFVTSLEAMRRLSGSLDGFGGNFGGIEGADRICQNIAEGVGAGHKTWRAFLSATRGPDGNPVHAIERVGEGPWYDANERLVSENISGLLNERPDGDPQTINDLPDEHGVPISALGDAHDVVTASNLEGRLDSMNPESTCIDSTSADGAIGGDLIVCGHTFPRMAIGGRPGGGGDRPGGGRGGQGGANWMSDHKLRGCAPGVEVRNIPGGGRGANFIGASGGYGGLYCFALTP